MSHRADHRGEGMSLGAARFLAERAHEGHVDASGVPSIAHAGRVAAGVPLFARAADWLHDVVERSEVDQSMLITARASPDERVALRLLSRAGRACSDDVFLEGVRVIARASGASGRIARAVKRADLLDHVARRATRSELWSPPYGAALAVPVMVGATSAGADPRWS